MGWAGETKTRVVVARRWRTEAADLDCFPDDGERR
jgi:hypothetical protein